MTKDAAGKSCRGLAAGRGPPRRLPPGQGIPIEPEGQVATPLQPSLIGWPVLHSEALAEGGFPYTPLLRHYCDGVHAIPHGDATMIPHGDALLDAVVSRHGGAAAEGRATIFGADLAPRFCQGSRQTAHLAGRGGAGRLRDRWNGGRGWTVWPAAPPR